MKKLLLLIPVVVLVLGIVYAGVDKRLGKYRRVGTTYNEHVILEKTGAGDQEMIAGTSGSNICVKAIYGNMTAATKLYFGYLMVFNDAIPQTTVKITSIYDLAAKDQFEWVPIDPVVLPVGEGLDCWTLGDPGEGWFNIQYDLVNYTATEGSTY